MNSLNGASFPHDVLLAIIASTLLILLLIAGIVIAFYMSGRQRIKEKITLAETKLAFERELRAVETEVTESIMGQIAQELHDNVGQLITALHIQVENHKLDHPELAQELAPAESYITEINEQLRLLSRTLNNDFLGNIGLLPALHLEVARLNSLRRLKVSCRSNDGSSHLEKNEQLMVFRIFQEIAQNTMKHAQAKNLDVRITNQPGHFRMETEDNGLGFDYDAVIRSPRASGLLNIQKRAALAGLSFQVQSVPGKGSLFVLEKKDKLG